MLDINNYKSYMGYFVFKQKLGVFNDNKRYESLDIKFNVLSQQDKVLSKL